MKAQALKSGKESGMPTGMKVKNPGKTLGRVLGYVFKRYAFAFVGVFHVRFLLNSKICKKLLLIMTSAPRIVKRRGAQLWFYNPRGMRYNKKSERSVPP